MSMSSSPDVSAPDGSVAQVDFGGLSIEFDHRVLQPRPWTLAQASWASDLLVSAPPGPVLELCAGVGHIGLAATADTTREIVLVDLNPVACDFARRNASAAGMAARVDVREGPMDGMLDVTEHFALIIADPPWVPSADTRRFPEDPLIAIDGGHDGLDLARACCDVIAEHLHPSGHALLQLGTTDQAVALGTHLRGRLRVRESRTYESGVVLLLTR